MLTNALIARGVAIDSARLTGKTIYLWHRLLECGCDITVDQGMAVGAENYPKIPNDATLYARVKPIEACVFCIKNGTTIPWHKIALAAALRDAKEYRESQSVWRLDADRYFTCHESIVLSNAVSGAQRLEVFFVP
jgi:hypothetical protein